MKRVYQVVLYFAVLCCLALDPPKAQGSESYLDWPVVANPVTGESGPSIAVKPISGKVMVAVTQLDQEFPICPDNPECGTARGRCGAYRSVDGGKTWQGPTLFPSKSGQNQYPCSSPVVRWSPDSLAVYAAYLVQIGDFGNKVLVTRSVNEGKSWKTPVCAIGCGGLPAEYESEPFNCSLSVPPISATADAKGNVYVSADVFQDWTNGYTLAFARSTDHGTTFSQPQVIMDGNETSYGFSQPFAGIRRDVLFCWSIHDPYRNEEWYSETGIGCKASTDGGATFSEEFTVTNMRLRGKPSVVVSQGGVAHMVFAADPNPDIDKDQGDIFYVKSPRPYSATSWSQPQRISDDPSGNTQGSPSISLKRLADGHYKLAVFWQDYRNSTPGTDLYEVYADTNLPALGLDIKITDISSFDEGPGPHQDPEQGYLARRGVRLLDSSSTNVPAEYDPYVRVIWTDRRNGESDIYTDRVRINPLTH